MSLFSDLMRDTEDGKWSHSKIGVIIAGFLFSVKMSGLPTLLEYTMPADPTLWLFFMATVGGYSVLLKLIAKRGL